MTLAGRRLLFFVPSLEVGGAQRQAIALADHLRGGEGAEVGFWAFSPGGRAATLLSDLGIACATSPVIDGGPATKVWGLLRLVRQMRRFRPDILLPFCDFPNKVCGAVWELTGAASCVWNQRDEGREVTGRPIERRAVRRTPLFVANSEEGRLFLNRQFQVPDDRIRIIHNGAFLDPPRRSREQWRRELVLDEDTVVTTMVANISWSKDHRTLIRAWQRLVDHGRGRSPVLLLAGRPCDTHDEVRGMIAEAGLEESVRLLGEVDDVAGLLHASDLGVHSSKREGLPNAILECMAASLPVVATDIIGAREALGDTYPHLVPPADPGALANQILKLVHDPGERERLGARNAERVRAHFPPEAMFRRYVSLIEELLAGP